MGVLKPAKALGQGGGGAVTVASITDATVTGKALLQATDDAAARQEIGAMGTEGDQVIDGHLQVKEKLTIIAPDPGAATWVTLLDIPMQDGTPGASLDYSHGADGSSFLRFCLRMADGTLRQLLLLSPRMGPNGQPGGIGLPGDSFLQVGNGYALDQVTDTGYAVFTAADKETARTAMAAMGTDGDQVITGKLDVDKCLSVKLQGPEDPVNYQTLFQVKQPDGTVCATISVYNQDAPGATFLRFSALTQTGQLKKVMEIQGLDGKSVGGGSGYGGVEINSGCYLSVNNYLLDQVTATGYAVYTAQDEAAARTAIGAGTSDLTATPFGEQLLQCADADAVKALLGL
ncbi:hypothetical protein AAY84_12125 [Serratia marcescens]|uniref:hypothetical protein n=1 Tax=Serratia marcescens TaxID=615 RepID=UPI00062CA295|nr:hypothetical protein [Serratia marcescens]KKZ18094.1 hypothetical protein AAY84_12125 [Serratia marcescens]